MACLVARLGHAPISAHSRSGSFPSNRWTLSRRPFRRCRRSHAAADDGATDDFSPAVPSAKTVIRYVSRRGSRSSGSSDGKFSSLKSKIDSLKSENTSLKSQLDSLKSQLDNERVGRSRDGVMCTRAVLEIGVWVFVVKVIYAPAKPDTLIVAGLAFGFKVVDLASTILQFGLTRVASALVSFFQFCADKLGWGKDAPISAASASA